MLNLMFSRSGGIRRGRAEKLPFLLFTVAFKLAEDAFSIAWRTIPELLLGSTVDTNTSLCNSEHDHVIANGFAGRNDNTTRVFFLSHYLHSWQATLYTLSVHPS